MGVMRPERFAARFIPRFWANVQKTEGCWPWTRTRNNDGYGTVGRGLKVVKAHRVAWELTHGPIPDGLCVLHRCDNPPCCNPGHLFLGTKRDNAIDRAAKGRGYVPGPNAPPPPVHIGESNVNAKLNPSVVTQIRERRAAGATMPALAREFRVGKSTIFSIVHGHTWRTPSHDQTPT